MSDQGTQGLLSPWLRRHRLAAAKPHLKGSVLDFGCGSGALAAFVAPGDYVGYDVDAASLDRAHSLYPSHTFVQSLPVDRVFDRVVSLAVIEHMPDPPGFLSQLASFAKPGGRIVLTTPNPRFDFLHHYGSAIGLFSHDASEEHVSLLDHAGLQALANQLALKVVEYRRFLMGANQLLVLEKPSSQ